MSALTEIALKKTIKLIENGKMPDFITRAGIRKLLSERLDSLRFSTEEAHQNYIHQYVDSLKKFPLAVMTKEANEQHYEVPTKYYDFCLGRHKKYSSCFWDKNTTTLEEAEQLSLDISIDHAQIQDGMSILELGCGWGSLSLELARRFPNSKIVSVSNSKTQKTYIDNEAKIRGFTNLEIKTLDLSQKENYHFDGENFDRVMSIEMMEHLRNYQDFFNLISKRMKPNAKFFIHIFTHKESPYLFETEGEDNWMGKYFFSGGQMPSINLFEYFNNDLVVQEKWYWNGEHYQRTLEEWLNRMDQNEEEVMKLFKETYGSEYAVTWFNRWRIFYMSCAELFGFNHGKEWGVTHYLLTHKDISSI